MNALSAFSLRRRDVSTVKLAYVEGGVGEPIIFIHGSWDDHHSWDEVASVLCRTHKIVTFDRRGHSSSTNVSGQGSINQDVFDVVGLMNVLEINSAHIVGHSYGANIAIALCERAEKKIRSVFIHEPPIFSLLTGEPGLDDMRVEYLGIMKKVADLIKRGQIEDGAKLFVEQVAFGKNAWTQLFDECARRSMLANVDTWLDQYLDPDRLAVDAEALRNVAGPVTISYGSVSLPPYEIIARRISGANKKINLAKIEGAGHGAHISHSRQVALEIISHLKQ